MRKMNDSHLSDLQLGLLLGESLEAAFCGAVFDRQELLAEWGKVVSDATRAMYPDQIEVHEIIRRTACDILVELISQHNCGQLLRDILFRPEAFLRSIVAVLKLGGDDVRRDGPGAKSRALSGSRILC